MSRNNTCFFGIDRGIFCALKKQACHYVINLFNHVLPRLLLAAQPSFCLNNSVMPGLAGKSRSYYYWEKDPLWIPAQHSKNKPSNTRSIHSLPGHAPSTYGGILIFMRTWPFFPFMSAHCDPSGAFTNGSTRQKSEERRYMLRNHSCTFRFVAFLSTFSIADLRILSCFHD